MIHLLLPKMIRCLPGLSLLLVGVLEAEEPPALGVAGVREQRVMIPMRDGVRLSAWLYLPEGEGTWPAVFEQRYADISGLSTRKRAAELALRGYAVAMVSFRGA